MRKMRHCRVTILIFACWAVCSAVGFLLKDTVYQQYTIDARTTPYFVLVLEGIHDGVYPWSGEEESVWDKWAKLADAHKKNGQNVPPAGETVGTESVQTETETAAAETEAVTETSVGEQLKSFCEVDDDYFSDAVFIGDSRTVGLHDYGGLDDATFYATVGMNIYKLWTEEFCEVDGFMTAYEEAVQKFRELQPDAVIFVQGIMKVTKEKSDSDPIFNNEGIEERNERIAALADQIHIFYIDVNEVVCGEDGSLMDDLTFDNIHLYGSKYGIWVDFLKKKGILL